MQDYSTWFTLSEQDILDGYCKCGCGQKTPVTNRTRRGLVANEPTKYLPGHGRRRLVLDRFWEKLKVSSPDECWEWQGTLDKFGYGIISINAGRHYAHRFSYELHFGPIPAGMFICHKCDNPLCSNPAHLFVGDRYDNANDMKAKGRCHLGEKHGNAKLTAEDVVEIRKLAATGMTQTALAQQFGVTRSGIASIVQRTCWQHIP